MLTAGLAGCGIAHAERVNQLNRQQLGTRERQIRRIKPLEANPTDEQRAKHHQTFIAYAGTYTVQADKVLHHVDISWNEAWT